MSDFPGWNQHVAKYAGMQPRHPPVPPNPEALDTRRSLVKDGDEDRVLSRSYNERIITGSGGDRTILEGNTSWFPRPTRRRPFSASSLPNYARSIERPPSRSRSPVSASETVQGSESEYRPASELRQRERPKSIANARIQTMCESKRQYTVPFSGLPFAERMSDTNKAIPGYTGFVPRQPRHVGDTFERATKGERAAAAVGLYEGEAAYFTPQFDGVDTAASLTGYWEYVRPPTAPKQEGGKRLRSLSRVATAERRPPPVGLPSSYSGHVPKLAGSTSALGRTFTEVIARGQVEPVEGHVEASALHIGERARPMRQREAPLQPEFRVPGYAGHVPEQSDFVSQRYGTATRDELYRLRQRGAKRGDAYEGSDNLSRSQRVVVRTKSVPM